MQSNFSPRLTSYFFCHSRNPGPYYIERVWILCYTVMKVKHFCFSIAHLNNNKIDHLSGQHDFLGENNPFFSKTLESVLSGSSLYPTFLKESSTEITTAVVSARVQHYLISIRQCDTISSDTTPLFPVYSTCLCMLP